MNGMKGKVALVTGATNGIGRVAARELAQAGATVTLVGRNPQRIEDTLAEIRAAVDGAHVDGIQADLSLQADVRRLAEEFRARHERLDVLLNNAGGVFPNWQETAEGHERTFALNHLAYFLLTNLLLDMLKDSAPARVISISSSAHRQAGAFDFEGITRARNNSMGMGGMARYSQSKLANILFTRELARRLEGTGVTANAVHPGVVNTGLFAGRGLLNRVAQVLGPLLMRSPEKGAETMIWLATAPEIATSSGGYYADCRPANISAAAQDEAAARRLWALSAEMCGLAEE